MSWGRFTEDNSIPQSATPTATALVQFDVVAALALTSTSNCTSTQAGNGLPAVILV